MKIQSLSIVIPTKRCINDCPFCVSKMHDNKYENSPNDFFQMAKRIKFASNNGVNTLILTGTGEALQNRKFMTNLSGLLSDMDHPFPNVELQTTGIFLNKSLESVIDNTDNTEKIIKSFPNLDLLKGMGVNTISLSICDIFSDERNMDIMRVPKILRFKLKEMVELLKSNGFNIRFSLNMIDDYNTYTPEQILSKCERLGADQVTFRKLYKSVKNTPENIWVTFNSCKTDLMEDIDKYIYQEGNKLYQLSYGPIVFSINGMSTVLDNDCMSKTNDNSLKYLILREDAKLYCRWDDKGSLIF